MRVMYAGMRAMTKPGLSDLDDRRGVPPSLHASSSPLSARTAIESLADESPSCHSHSDSVPDSLLLSSSCEITNSASSDEDAMYFCRTRVTRPFGGKVQD